MQKKGHFLGHPMWRNNIEAGHNDQAEKNGATLASWYTTKKLQEHHELNWFKDLAQDQAEQKCSFVL